MDGPIEASVQTEFLFSNNPSITQIAALISFDGDIPDDRATWHRNYTVIENWMRAHILREVNGWSIKETANRIRKSRDLPQTLGFFAEKPKLGAKGDPPSYTQLRDIWEETFTDRHRGAVLVIADRLVEYCRENGIPAPADVFQPEDDVEAEPDVDDPTVRELTTEKTLDVWKHAKPMVLRYWHLKRHHNYQVPESTFFDAQAYMGSGDDIFPETGLGNLAIKGEHGRVHFPSTHRRELSKFDVEEIRQLHRDVTNDLIKHARSKGELVGELGLAIDFTFGHPWTGEIERDIDGNNVEPWILGYVNDNDPRPQYYFQWATIQVVGLDIPLVLDALPVRRGRTRADIVDDLLGHALDMVDDAELLYMDSEFSPDDVKTVCEEHGVYYLNSGRMASTDGTPDRMREQGRTVHIDIQESLVPDAPSRKTLYLPAEISSHDDDTDESEEDQDTTRQQLIDDFPGAGNDEFADTSPIASLVDDIREEEDLDADGDEGEVPIVKFETNHPDIQPRSEAEDFSDVIHMVTRHVRRYSNRWGIENGYKKIKQFLPRSASPNHVLRFFNFAFAATLYNSWRLVDLLVKLSVEDDPAYTPLVTAQRFREIAQQYFGLDNLPPPDEPVTV